MVWTFLANGKYVGKYTILVGGFTRLKNISQNGNLPQIEVKMKNI